MCSAIIPNKVLISGVNLHTGGGVQVATSFLHELSLIQNNNVSIDVFVSTEVADGLARLNTNTSDFNSYEVINTYGLKAFFSRSNSRIKNYDVVFTVFGPNYSRARGKKEIVGFAQLWILNFENPISERMSFLSKNILRLKFCSQWLFFLRADHYIVELEHVKEGLITSKGIDSDKITVVYNTVSSLYLDTIKWKPILIEKEKEVLSLGIVARDYPHKNLEVLPFVAEILNTKYNIKSHFYVTLNELEWANKNDFFKKYVSTVGSLSPEQCPSFYEQIDGVVFPSLLECFSATPLEAMVMSKPLFASDRGFVRDVCGSHATYFDPLDANNIADHIANYFKSNLDRTDQLQQARNHALNFSSAKGRAEQYLEIIQQHLES